MLLLAMKGTAAVLSFAYVMCSPAVGQKVSISYPPAREHSARLLRGVRALQVSRADNNPCKPYEGTGCEYPEICRASQENGEPWVLWCENPEDGTRREPEGQANDGALGSFVSPCHPYRDSGCVYPEVCQASQGYQEGWRVVCENPTDGTVRDPTEPGGGGGGGNTTEEDPAYSTSNPCEPWEESGCFGEEMCMAEKHWDSSQSFESVPWVIWCETESGEKRYITPHIDPPSSPEASVAVTPPIDPIDPQEADPAPAPPTASASAGSSATPDDAPATQADLPAISSGTADDPTALTEGSGSSAATSAPPVTDTEEEEEPVEEEVSESTAPPLEEDPDLLGKITSGSDEGTDTETDTEAGEGESDGEGEGEAASDGGESGGESSTEDGSQSSEAEGADGAVAGAPGAGSSSYTPAGGGILPAP
ncbi:unnamed protein product [Vitrella brassicaformis CCMP3155]|uniref:Uncharacterized protein n=2 Tax=Vitrella brassicaformis TaxID=1169539 RepID=A0A0G4ELQ1_VITBC|nr:unnamed protein product [Vitrella brassicaformis CCMP3155]|mmetsp:Transcript_40903/g.116523  ORF Transcript_40903/g.116523 Transcript_40903/m.116523 type:complete len:422 (+) Transcript_40903:106-1371(+)|eukprot:CEL98041.1 unnamed protein product [Vitrella brassicaformis CCMP3155]